VENKTNLNRALGLTSVVVIVIANILGSGVYKKIAPMAAELGSSAWVLGAWIAGGIITLFGALCNAEIAGLLAETGGEYSYYKKIYNKFFAFLYGWSLFSVIQSAGIASLAYVFSQSLNSVLNLPQLLPNLQHYELFGLFLPFENFSVKLIAILLISCLTFINSRGVKSVAKLSNVLLILVFIGIGLIIIFGLGSSQSNLNLILDSSIAVKPVTVSAFLTAMLAAFWAYQGWSSIGFIGGEIKDASKNIPRGISIGLFIVIAIYVVVNATYLSLLSINDLISINAAGNQIAAVKAVEIFWGQYGVVFISVLILITTLGCTHATIMSSCRAYFAMAKEGMFFKKVAVLNTNQAPANALKFQGVWASILVLSGTFDQLTDMIIFAVYIYYGATAFGVFILRKKMPNANRPYKVWGYPIVPAFFVLFCIALFINTIISKPREAAFGMILMGTGVPLYYWFVSKNKKNTQ
jgi:APA family basic amino acid/polyamine antiporter